MGNRVDAVQSQVDRRAFITAASALPLAAACLGPISSAVASTFAQQTTRPGNTPTSQPSKDKPGRKPIFEISLAQWSLHRMLRSGSLDALDFAPFTRTEFDIGAVEYVNSFFKDKARNPAYLAELKSRAAEHNVRSLLIMVDGEGALGAPDPKQRLKAVQNHHRWVEAAKTLGCHSIRVNAQSQGERHEQVKLAADGLRTLTEFAATHELNVIVENHGGLSSDGSWLAEVMATVDHPRCGTLPDFGNFLIGDGVWYDRYKGVKELMPYAKAVSAKTHDFNESGMETTTDYNRMMKIVYDAGYRGYVGIEYEGNRLSEVEGIRATKKLLERVRTELTASLMTPAAPKKH